MEGDLTVTCSKPKKDGTPCKANVLAGSDTCRWHSDDPAQRQRHLDESRKGGLSKAYGAIPSVAPLADRPGVADMNLETAEGLRGFLGATLQRLARLPFDSRVANSISSLATAQRALIEASDFERRLSDLEKEAHSTVQSRRGLKSA